MPVFKTGAINHSATPPNVGAALPSAYKRFYWYRNFFQGKSSFKTSAHFNGTTGIEDFSSGKVLFTSSIVVDLAYSRIRSFNFKTFILNLINLNSRLSATREQFSIDGCQIPVVQLQRPSHILTIICITTKTLRALV
ncbi:MAG: hypothetical protein JWQ35_204 [Bacteriovoracaceae bacterium]|nr:hypothetical protein [Bacteriovoracaceae bacterium]